jgi:hypothetical protein
VGLGGPAAAGHVDRPAEGRCNFLQRPRVPEKAAEVERLLKKGVAEVWPEMLVRVETAITRSVSKLEPGPRYLGVRPPRPSRRPDREPPRGSDRIVGDEGSVR